MTDLNDPMMAVIGQLAVNAERPPDGSPTVQLAWRTGYQNALSDLIAELFPDSPGGRRLSIEEIAAGDDERAY